ncbi:MAG: DUF6089 family protein [Chitinophagaceae bacterium]
MKTQFLKVSFLLLGCALWNSLTAQDTLRTNSVNVTTKSADRFSTKDFRTWSIGVHAGVLTPYTIFRGNSNDFNSPSQKLGYGVYIKKQILPAFGLQGEFLKGIVEGSKASSLINDPTYLSSSFKTNIKWSTALTANLTVASFNINRINSYFAPYIKAGAGYMETSTKLTDITGTGNNDKNDSWYIPVGTGIKVGISNGINIDLGYDVNFMKSSNFDGLSTGRYDNFSYGHFGVEFSLGKKSNPPLSRYSAIADLRKSSADEAAELRSAMLIAQQDALNTKNQYDIQQAQLARDLADDDNDGVANKFDKCPNTPKDSTVDGAGCPFVVNPQVIKETKVVITEDDRRIIDEAIRNLEFDLGKATLRSTSYETLNRVAEILKQKNFSLKLAGHTDNTGPMELNLRLSKERAESVKAYLVSQGANPSRIEATGYGPNQPIATNKTEAGRQQNRRVEFTLF